MPVHWDAVVARALVRELGERLGDARAVALVMNRPERSFALHFRECTLDWWLAPDSAGLRVARPREPDGVEHRIPATVRGIGADHDERVIHLALRRVRGKSREVGLHLELLPGRENLIMTEGAEERVKRWLRAPPPTEGRLTIGQPYSPPERSERAGADGDLTFEEWTRILEGDDSESRLLDRVAWTSRFNAKALLSLELRAGWQLWQVLASGSQDAGYLIRTRRGMVPYPIPMPQHDSTTTASLLEAFERLRAGSAADDGDPGIAPLRAQARKLEKLVASLERQLNKRRSPEELRRIGDLLLARLGSVPAGVTEVEIEGFDGEPVRISLDPAKGPADNADAYYDRAARSERAAASLPDRITKARSDLTEVEAALTLVREEGRDPKEFTHLLPKRGARKGPTQQAPALPYHVFETSGGLEVRVGRSSKRNDELTFRHSSPEDIWLHARHVGGSHVVLRWSSKDAPPARDLEEAAVLAAVHSKARHAGTVPVDWTRRKYVRKPRGAPRGSVVIEREKTVFVRPDPEVVERLRPDEGAGPGSVGPQKS